MAKLCEYFGLSEAPEKNIPPEEIEKLWPNALVAWDRDSQGAAATFLQRTQAGTGEMTLYANSRGSGWWQYTDDPVMSATPHPSRDGSHEWNELGQWRKISKPSQQRSTDWQSQHGVDRTLVKTARTSYSRALDPDVRAQNPNTDWDQVARGLGGLNRQANRKPHMPGTKGKAKKGSARCPNCEGRGVFHLGGLADGTAECTWCHGSGRI
jgi:hypothetical protein